MIKPDPEAVKTYMLGHQEALCRLLETEDGDGRFHEDAWERAEGGAGRSRVMREGALFEQAGINFSHVHGDSLPEAASERRPELGGRRFQAMGVSLVVHPRNPYVPTAHANVRFFIAERADAQPVWWFGGGFDLTPYYGFDDDCRHWHAVARQACAPFGDDIYRRYKHWCDNYFHLPHRGEQRGIGGLFFDDLNDWGFERCFAFMRSVANHFHCAYVPIVQRRRAIPWGARERQFQLYRRGRYVEFNLLFDRGTKFGVQSGGRTESILMSLPPLARWQYGYTPEPGSAEERLTSRYLTPVDWLSDA